MFPRNENRNEGTFRCSPRTKTGTRVRSHVPPERKPERGHIRQNHPFTKPPFHLPVIRANFLLTRENFKKGNLKKGVRCERFDRTLSVVLKSLSQGSHRTFLGPKRGFDRTFWGSSNLFRGSIEPSGGFDRAFLGGRRLQGTVLKFPLLSTIYTKKITNENQTNFTSLSLLLWKGKSIPPDFHSHLLS